MYNGKYLAITDPPRDIAVDTKETDVTFVETTARLTAQELNMINSGTIFNTKQTNRIIITAAYDQVWNVLKNDMTFAPFFKEAKILGKPMFIKGEYLVTFTNNNVTFKITLNKVADLQQIQVLGMK